jgi:hypothetical protein
MLKADSSAMRCRGRCKTQRDRSIAARAASKHRLFITLPGVVVARFQCNGRAATPGTGVNDGGGRVGSYSAAYFPQRCFGHDSDCSTASGDHNRLTVKAHEAICGNELQA